MKVSSIFLAFILGSALVGRGAAAGLASIGDGLAGDEQKDGSLFEDEAFWWGRELQDSMSVPSSSPPSPPRPPTMLRPPSASSPTAPGPAPSAPAPSPTSSLPPGCDEALPFDAPCPLTGVGLGPDCCGDGLSCQQGVNGVFSCLAEDLPVNCGQQCVPEGNSCPQANCCCAGLVCRGLVPRCLPPL